MTSRMKNCKNNVLPFPKPPEEPGGSTIICQIAETEKRCAQCDQDLRAHRAEVSERYHYILAQMTVIEDVCFPYACTVKTARGSKSSTCSGIIRTIEARRSC